MYKMYIGVNGTTVMDIKIQTLCIKYKLPFNFWFSSSSTTDYDL